MTTVVGFDVSGSRTGWAVLNAHEVDGDTVYDIVEVGAIEPNKKDTVSGKLVFFRAEAKKVLKKHQPDVVVIEDVFIRQLKVAVLLARFSGVLLELVRELLDKDARLINATSARKLLGIYPNSKENAYEYIRNRYGAYFDVGFKTFNDVADAVVVALAVLKKE